MTETGRSFSDVLQDIIGNVREIVRSEAQLAKSELLEDFAKTKSASLMIGIGVMIAFLAALFLLLSAVHSLTLVMPAWAAAMIVGFALAIIASILIAKGVDRFKI